MRCAVSAPAGRSSSRRSGSPAQTYPHSRFPDPASALVDLERQDAFEEAGAHFESRYFLTFVWLPPAEDASRAEGWLYEGRAQTGVDPWELLRGFVDRTNRVLQLVEGFMPEAEWLDDGETLTYLHSTHLDARVSASACPRRRCISTRCSPMSRSPAGSSRASAARICAC